MLFELKVKSLAANLPLEDSEIFFLLNDQKQRDSLPENLNFEPSDDYVLMSEVSHINVPPTQFLIDLLNPEDSRSLQLYVLAISNSNSKLVLLGRAQIEVPFSSNSFFQNQTSKILRKHLEGIQNQKGTVTVQLSLIEQHFHSYYKNEKSNQSLDKEETTSSDSYEANLKQINKITELQGYHHPMTKQLYFFQNQRNADFSQSVILEEIDLEDFEDESQPNSLEKTKLFPKEPETEEEYKKTSTNKRNKTNKRSKNHRKDILSQKLKIESYLHRLQQSDYFLMKIEQSMSYYIK